MHLCARGVRPGTSPLFVLAVLLIVLAQTYDV